MPNSQSVSARTTQGNWIPEIDGLRFVAIAGTILAHILGEICFRSAYVLSDHIRTDVFEITSRGARGVQLFFAISGFIVAQPFLRQYLRQGPKVSLRAYFKRRLTRLEPPYILSLLIYTVAWTVRGGFGSSIIRSLLSHIVYLLNFTHLASLNFVTWNLEAEVQFYILAPLFGCSTALRSTGLRRGLMVALIVCSCIIGFAMTRSKMAWNLPGQLQFFMVGYLVADIRARRLAPTTNHRWDVVGLFAWIAFFAITERERIFLPPDIILIAFLATFYGTTALRIFRTSWITLTGGMCYSFYPMHMLPISTAFRFTGHLVRPSNFAIFFLIQTFILGTCVYLCCTVFYCLIERPCMDPEWSSKVVARLSNKRETLELV